MIRLIAGLVVMRKIKKPVGVPVVLRIIAHDLPVYTSTNLFHPHNRISSTRRLNILLLKMILLKNKLI